MRHPSRHRSEAITGLLAAAVALGPALSGCGSSRPGTRVLHASEFASSDAPGVPVLSRSPMPAPAAPATLDPPRLIALAEATREAPSPQAPGEDEPVLVDAKVGDINGRAVYASKFFGGMEERLRAEARTKPRDRWLEDTEREIARKLNDQIQEELLRAEAIASLPEAQREVGLRNMMDSLRQERVRKGGGGSAAEAEQALRDETGMDIDSYVRRQGDRELIRYQLHKRVQSRVHVSWREIQQEFERRYGEFNPAPTARFVWIRVRDSRTEDIAFIEAELASGTDFRELAAIPANGYQPDKGGVYDRQFEGEFAGGKFFVSEALNAAAVTLAPGAWTGPIRADGFVSWLMLASIDRVSNPPLRRSASHSARAIRPAARYRTRGVHHASARARQLLRCLRHDAAPAADRR
jgi:hypothetical protein